MKDRYVELSRKTYAPSFGEAPASILGALVLQERGSEAPVAVLKLRMDAGRDVSAVGVRVFLKNASGLLEEPENFWYDNLHVGQGETFGAKVALPLHEPGVTDVVAEVAAARFADGDTWFLENSCGGAEAAAVTEETVRESPAADEAPAPEKPAELTPEEIAAREAAEAERLEQRRLRRKKIRKFGLAGVGAAAAAALMIFLIIPLAKYVIANSKMEKGEYAKASALYASLNKFGQSRDRRVVANALQSITDGEFEDGISSLLSKDVSVHIGYDVGDGRFTQKDTPSDVTYGEPGAFREMPEAEREYYNFVGWNLDQTAYSVENKMMLSDLRFSAKYEPVVYRIDYVGLETGSTTNPVEYHVESGDIRLTDAVREGYSFLGWSGDGIGEKRKDVCIPGGSHGDRSFQANWEANSYTVTVSSEGEQVGTGEEEFTTKTFEFTYDDAYSLPKMQRTGYDFVGWTDGKNTYLDGVWNCAKDVELKPSFELKVYKLTYAMADGTPDKANPESYTMLDEDIQLNGASRFGYDFVGWTWDGQPQPQNPAVIPSGSVGDKVITAVWKGHPHKVTMDPNGGSLGNTVASVTFGSAYSLPVPVKTGYDFTGWFSGSTKYTSGTWDLDQDVSVKASWSAKKFNIPLNANGGSGVPGSMSVTYGGSYSLPTPSRRGYTFRGWFANGQQYTSGTWNVDGVVTMSASWEGNKYSVSLNANGGSVSNSSMSVVFGDSYSLPKPKRVGYDFKGWSTSSSSYGSTFQSSGIWNNDGNVTLYAKWEVKLCTIHLNLNGGSYYYGTSEDVRYGSRYYLSDPTREGYEFDGWYYDGDKFPDSGTYEYDGDITISAKWKGKSYTVYLDANGGSGVPSSISVTYGSSYSLPTPSRSGYTFDGWYTSRSGGSRFSSSGTWKKTSYESVYAHWIPIAAPAE